MLAVAVVKTVRHIARHLDVLNLVAPHRHVVGVKHQNVCAHQHRVHEQAGGHVRVRVKLGGQVFVHRCLVGVGAIQDALAGHTGQKPGQLGNLRHVRLAVKHHARGV